ncbi:MAG: SpoIIE family protein phosphatase [candidate division Zixibacteria bacterium]|nr:SpoIIE family protein phosphatase [candidate division Zixibacteria bacterium]
MNDNMGKNAGSARIVIVDDEPLVLDSLGSFLELETDHELVRFESPLEALNYIKRLPIDLIISDFLMPEMNGLELLAQVKHHQPETPRILLTGYADKENAIRAINEVGLFQYIEKPWDNDQVLLAIRSALETRSLRQSLREKIDELDSVLISRAEVIRRENILKEELELARRVHKRLLPRRLPEAYGFKFWSAYYPMMEIGGDFYDIINIADGRLCLLLADATGHGIQAAFSTALLKFAFSSFAGSEFSPAEILTGMNKIIRRGLPPDTFISASVAEIDSLQSKIRFANGGLPYPYLVKPAKADFERVASNGMMLGMMDQDSFEAGDEITVELDPGDYLVLYTDGLNEAKSSAGEFFENKAMCDCLKKFDYKTCGELVEKLIDSVNSFTAKNAEDDITLIGIEKS